MKSDEIFRGTTTGRTMNGSKSAPGSRPQGSLELEVAQAGESRSPLNSSQDYARIFAVADNGADDATFHSGAAKDQEFVRFQDRLRRGKVKLCSGCGGVMVKSSRMILSPLSGTWLVMLGVVLMALYGLATNFYQTPWFVKFALPAGYYVGSIFIGVGILFFFIREKVWSCPRCKEVCKR